MYAATRPWITAHGLKKLRRERTDLQHWLDHLTLRLRRAITDHAKNKEIALILSEERVVENRLKAVAEACGRVRTLPSAWYHKREARAGDTLYLAHKDNIRALYLTTVWNADPANGKVSVTSPMGLTLVGRHPGDVVHLQTLDGEVAYRILKIL